MSDQWGPTASDDGEGTPPAPPPPPAGASAAQPTPIEPVLTLDSESALTRSGGAGGRVLAGILVALVLVGGTVFAVSQLGSSGPGSPEDAVAELLDAASNEDVLGLLAALDSGERDALRDPVERMFEQLERLEVLDDSFSLDGVAGIDLAFEDVTYRTEPIRDDLARVYFTGGTVTGSLQSDEIPIGDFVSDTLERFDADISGVEESATSDIADTDIFLVARNGSDGWRVSIGYTAAEAARLDAGLPLDGAAAIEPVGSDSPEEAVEGLLRATVGFDLRTAIAHLSPGELGALQDYAGLFIDDAAAELATAAEEVDISIDDLSLRSEASGDRASVFVDGFAVTVTVDGETLSVGYTDGCFTLDGDMDGMELEETPFAEGPVCTADFEEVMEDFYGTSAMTGSGSGDMDLPEFPSLDPPTIGITTTRVDGDWYVAPIATGMDAMIAGLESIERSHLDAIVDFVEEMMTSFQEGFMFGDDYTETYEEYGDPQGPDRAPATTPLSDDFSDDFSEDFSDEASEWEDVAPTTSVFSGSSGKVDEAALEEFVFTFTGDDVVAGCILGELSRASDFVRYELADAYVYDYEPSPESQDAFFGALDTCGA